ncbi:MAG: metallophosphoesterase family protein [Gammaproteobacteria bacterium]|nr:metallophosphoesterase family protein [Gammaproteobacteria bacterium]
MSKAETEKIDISQGGDLRLFTLIVCQFTVFFITVAPEAASTFTVGPYLQTATPTSIQVMWEVEVPRSIKPPQPGSVKWGLSPENLLYQTVSTPISVDQASQKHIHHASLSGLEPDSIYYYQVEVSDSSSAVYSFKTPPLPRSGESFAFVVYTDTQSRPEIHKKMVDKIKEYFEGTAERPAIAEKNLLHSLAFVLVSGDIVSEGYDYKQYKTLYFDPAEGLAQHIPYYPTIGNHEYYVSNGEKPDKKNPYYFDYMRLPPNGPVAFLQRFYSFNYSNIHVIGLDSNDAYTLQSRPLLDWLRRDLRQACNNSTIDFIFLQTHHPYKSELWPAGEQPALGGVIKLMEKYLNRCDKAGGHFFGHTHAYSRGQSRDSNFIWVNAGTAGGWIDIWGAYPPNVDYPEFQRTFDELGFVVVEVIPGENPSFKLTRFSFGAPETHNYQTDIPLHRAIQDRVTYQKNNTRPERPIAQAVLSESKPFSVTVMGSPFIDPEGQQHLESHFQITLDSGHYDNIPKEWDRWIRFENWYNGDPNIQGWDPNKDVNTEAGSDITQISFNHLLPDKLYYCRIRYRDAGLKWSEWSEERVFSIP